jgi:predicted small lipoprotein YifL
MRARLRIAAAAALLSLAGCGEGEPAEPRSAAAAPSGPDRSAASAPARLRPPPCPSSVAGCERASGAVLYVERRDPDGDGDAHVVLASAEGITAPGLSVIDIKPDLRPDPLPGPGDQVAAAGPVYSGSFGQRQIEAIAVRVGER